tara:strand:- start:504 stop:944 length:441 start_codon:yes stop_codon:yes gene_type:complete
MAKAGRPAGSINQPKRLLISRLEEMYGSEFNPVMKMAENAVVLQRLTNKSIDDYEFKSSIINAASDGLSEEDKAEMAEILAKLAGGIKSNIRDSNEAWDKISQYVQPKLKSIEVKAEISAEMDVHHTVTLRKARGKQDSIGAKEVD